MSSNGMPWYVRLVIGLGAWVTALVLIALGASFVYGLLELDSGVGIAVFGALFFALGLWLLWKGPSGVFGEQLGIATAAAGGAMICGGIAAEAESLGVGCFVAAILTAVVIAVTEDKILQFLTASLTSGLYVAALLDAHVPFAFDLVALATPAGLALLLYPPRRDLMPTAVALLLTFPVFSVLAQDAWYWRDMATVGGTFAKILHISLFLGLVYLHWRRGSGKANLQVAGFAVGAVVVCLLLPAGGSAAMLLLMLAFVIGSRPFALLGIALQSQFIVRYYYSLEMSLLDKSLLLMGVGGVLLVLWWLARRGSAQQVSV
jgi:Domain of unknown function (DUF4401)